MFFFLNNEKIGIVSKEILEMESGITPKYCKKNRVVRVIEESCVRLPLIHVTHVLVNILTNLTRVG